MIVIKLLKCEDNMDISNYILNYCLLSRMTVFFMIKKCLQMQSWSWKSLLFFNCILLNMQAISACRSSITKLGIRFTKGPHARNVIRRGEYLFIYIYSHTCIYDILYALRLANYYCMFNFIETCKTNARVLDRQGHCLGT